MLLHTVPVRSMRFVAALSMPKARGGAATRHEEHRAAGPGARGTRPGRLTWCVVIVLVAATMACSSPPPLPTTQSASGAADCSRFEGATKTPNRSLQPDERFRVEWRFANCGRTDWNGYRAVRIEGTFGPEVIPIQAWVPGTTNSLWIELPAPTTPGRYRLTYQLQGPRGPFGTFWTDLTVEGQPPPRQP